MPLQPGPLIGRDRAVKETCEFLRDPDIRLLTITGPPGVGKTRLAIDVASRVSGLFDDGATFVDLAPVGPALVLRAIAQALGMIDQGDTPLLEQTQTRLRDAHALLLLDNFEHVIAAAPQIAAILSHCRDLKILATSREPLRLSWEHEYALPPLEAPDPAWLVRPEAALRYPAVALFVQRAQAVQPGFAVNSGNGKAVAAICRRLDGLPLAIELAAARIRLFDPQALASLLAGGFELLAARVQDVAERHRTLQAAIAWSYDLLDPDEQRLFRRLGVFTGGFTLDAARAMGFDLRADIVELTTSLVAKSLVTTVGQGDEQRFAMLETIREFANGQLVAAGEHAEARRLHARIFLAMAEHAQREVRTPRLGRWLARLDLEAPNIRGTLDWAQQDDPQLALRIVGALGRFWSYRGRFSEGGSWASAAIESGRHRAEPAVLANALFITGLLARGQGDYVEAMARLEESLGIWRDLGDRRGVALALSHIGYTAYHQGEFTSARGILEDALRLARECSDREVLDRALNALGVVLQRQHNYEEAEAYFNEALGFAAADGDSRGVAGALTNLGSLARMRGEHETARRYQAQSLAMWRELGDRQSLALALGNFGNTLRNLGEGEAARAAYEEKLAISNEMGDRSSVGFALNGLGGLARERGEVSEAARICADALRVRQTLGEKFEIAKTLEEFARLAVAVQDPTVAVKLAAAATTLQRSIGVAAERGGDTLQGEVAAARRALGERGYAAAWATGVAMSVDQAVEFALAWGARPAGKPAPPGKLSRREVEVAVLITRGFTNRQIAAELVISERTADTHVQNILNKLGVSVRAQVAAWATREGLDVATH